MIIRKATTDDLEAINKIYNQAIETRSTGDITPISIEERKNWFRQHDPDNYPVFVAETENAVAGWISFSAYRPGRMAFRHTAEVSYYIDENFRKKGIGSKLIKFAIENGSSYGFKILLAIILDNNTGSISLIEKFQFKKWGMLPDVANFNGEFVGHLYYGREI